MWRLRLGSVSALLFVAWGPGRSRGATVAIRVRGPGPGAEQRGGQASNVVSG